MKKTRPHPWDTHHQFSIKLYSQRWMVEDDDLNVDQHQAEGQYNLQWMDTLIGRTSCAAGSGGNGQHPSKSWRALVMS